MAAVVGIFCAPGFPHTYLHRLAKYNGFFMVVGIALAFSILGWVYIYVIYSCGHVLQHLANVVTHYTVAIQTFQS